MIYVGIDWAEAHHDVCVLDDAGEVLGARRIPEGLEGVARLHALLGEHADEPSEVVVGIETERGLLGDTRDLRLDWFARWWRPATRSTRSTRSRPRGTATVTR